VIKIPGSPGRRFFVFAGVLLLVGAAGCGGSTSSKSQAAITPGQHSASADSTAQPASSPATQANAKPGHNTPQAESTVQPTSSPAVQIHPASSPATRASIKPGHDTPQDAVEGLIRAELSGNFNLACSYIDPSAKSTCVTAFSQPQAVPTFTGNFTVAGAVISGTEALVELTGRVCTAGSGCDANSDPSEGMPAGSTTFAQVYNNLINPSANANNSMSPVPCELINKSWYVSSAQ